MLFKLTPTVIYEAKKIFNEKDLKYILSTLLETDVLCEYQNEVERIRLAIIFGSKGKLDDFNDLINLSKIDYRDTLVGAGLGNSNWKEVLIKNGFDSLLNKNFNNDNLNIKYENAL
jgi:hypothetical protein